MTTFKSWIQAFASIVFIITVFSIDAYMQFEGLPLYVLSSGLACLYFGTRFRDGKVYQLGTGLGAVVFVSCWLGIGGEYFGSATMGAAWVFVGRSGWLLNLLFLPSMLVRQSVPTKWEVRGAALLVSIWNGIVVFLLIQVR